MILGLGIDTIEISRFLHWHTYSQKALKRVFCDQEIVYCLQNSQKIAERFAVRFAAKEAFFKALSAAFSTIILQSNTIFKHICVEKQPNSAPILTVAWDQLGIPETSAQNPPIVHISLSHSKTMATAIVILEKS